jgi:hypothetical protein
MKGTTCQWIHLDGMDEEYWLTECGNDFQFITGGVEDNGFQFCPYCGGELMEAEKDEEAQDE